MSLASLRAAALQLAQFGQRSVLPIRSAPVEEAHRPGPPDSRTDVIDGLWRET